MLPMGGLLFVASLVCLACVNTASVDAGPGGGGGGGGAAGGGFGALLRALKSYGMILSGTGETALSFADDQLSTAKWNTLGINANTFESLRVDDFEVAGLCAEIPLTSECPRVP